MKKKNLIQNKVSNKTNHFIKELFQDNINKIFKIVNKIFYWIQKLQKIAELYLRSM
jgi:hypothetical protein